MIHLNDIFFQYGLVIGLCYTFLNVPSALIISHYIIRKNPLYGFLASLGAWLVQLTWISIAVILMTTSSRLVEGTVLHVLSDIASVVGVLFLFYLSYRFFTEPVEDFEKLAAKTQTNHLARTIAMVAGIGFAVPGRILGYCAILAGIGIHEGFTDKGPLVFGVVLGVIIWWFLFCIFIHFLRN